MKRYAKLATLVVLALTFTMARAAYASASALPAESFGAQEGTAKSPHIDAEPNPADRKLEHAIKQQLKHDPHMAYSHVSVHVTDTEVLLSGTVVTEDLKQKAEQIATEHAEGRKVNNHLKVNPNTHPGSGL
jgi:osmotically-inducible protein OsmY